MISSLGESGNVYTVVWKSGLIFDDENISMSDPAMFTLCPKSMKMEGPSLRGYYCTRRMWEYRWGSCANYVLPAGLGLLN